MTRHRLLAAQALGALLAITGCTASQSSGTSPTCEPPPVEREGSDAGPIFRDVTAAVGLADDVHWDGYDWSSTPTQEEDDDRYRHLPAIMSGGVTIADVDGDGWEDIYAPHIGRPDALYMNVCGVEFVDIGAELGLAIPGSTSVALFFDADGDGDLDILTTGIVDTPHRLFINRNGSFVDEARERGIIRQDWTGGSFVVGAAAADYDTDGDIDIFLATWQPPITAPLTAGTSRLLANDGDGTFTDVTSDAGLLLDDVAAFTPTFADLTDDGIVDLALTGDWQTSRLFVGNGDGTFHDATAEYGLGQDRNGMGSVVADLTGDSRLDWFVSSIRATVGCGDHDFECEGNRLYQAVGQNRFKDAATTRGVEDGSWGWGADAADLDNDGDLDLVLVNGYENGSAYNSTQATAYLPFVADNSRLWINNGADSPMRELGADSGLADGGNGKAVVSADLDRDGDLDLVVGNTETGLQVFRNSTSGGNWLRARPVLDSGAPAIGAIVLLAFDGVQQRQDIRAGDTYQGQRSAVAHFGLGPSFEAPISVQIIWPDGEKTTHSLEPNQTHTITQPESVGLPSD